MAIILVNSGDSIQAAINGANAGDTIQVAAGTYEENITINNKELTIIGANQNVSGADGDRVAESSIIGRVTVTGSENVTFNGLEFRATTTTGTTGPGNPALRLQGAGDYSVINSVFYNETAGGPNAVAARAIYLDTSISGAVTIDGNLFTGAFTGKYDTASWNRGIWSDGTSSDLQITDNTFTAVRSAINLDGYDDADGSGNETTVSGNNFDVAGSAISVGIPDGQTFEGISNNTFNDVDTDFNFQNVATPVSIDLSDTLNEATPGNVMLVLGGQNSDEITGSDGSDILSGNGGSDTVNGGEGNDTLIGGAGNDSFSGGEGNDSLDGGTGIDTAVYATSLSASNFTDTGGVWTVNAGAAGTDTLVNVEKVDHAGEDNILLVGNGGYATIQEAINAADEGDTILISAGDYSESLTITTAGLTLAAIGEVNLMGPLHSLIGGDHLDAYFKANHPAYGGSTGISLNADDVTIRGLTISGFGVGLGLSTSDGVQLLDNTFTDNVNGIRKHEAAQVTDLTVNDNTFIHGIFGINVYADAGDAGSFDGITMNNNTFSHLTEKGMYFEQLSNATLDLNTFDDVGNWGRITPTFGGLSQEGDFGNAIDINLKYETYTNVTFTDTTITNSGHSNEDGGAASSAFGAAIGVKTRDDAPSYGGNPADFNGQIVFDGLTINGTSTGVRVGEPGKNNLDPDVRLENVTITNATVGDVDNATHPTNGATLEVNFSATQEDLDGSASQAPLDVTGNGLDNEIAGGTGDDTLAGGDGNDTYFVTSGDTVVEALNKGTDQVISTESVTLDDNVENLTLVDAASNTEDFEDFATGPIANGENGWTFAGSSDQEVIVDGGDKAFRMSSDPTSGAFGGPYTPTLSETAGEPATTADHDSMQVSFDFRAVQPEDGSRLEVDFGVANSTDRNNFMVIENVVGSGLRIAVADPLLNGDWDTGDGINDFTAFTGNRTLVEGLDASEDYQLTMVVRFLDGADNDVIDFYLNGEHIGSSTTFENYRDSLGGTHEVNAEANQVGNLFFRGSASGAPQDGAGGQNQGFVFDNIQYSTFDSAGPSGTGNALDNVITGNSGGNELSGLGGTDTLDGGLGDDTLDGGAGNDTLNGGNGTDTAVFSGDWTDYTVTTGSFVVVDKRDGSPDGTDTVDNDVEQFTFNNGTFDAADILNDAPTDIALSDDEVAESSADGTVVGELSATDADTPLGDTVTFTLLDDAGGRFELNNDDEIVVKNGSLLDFEAATKHDIVVKVTDAAGLSYQETITIDLENIAPQLKDAVDFNQSVVEGTTELGSVTVDGSDANATYSILPNLDGSFFEIDAATGELSFKAGRDFETKADSDGDNKYRVAVAAADAETIVSKIYEITITNGVVGSVTDTNTATADAIKENAPNGTAVGLMAFASDGAGSLTYSLTDDAGGRFQINASTGLVTVKDGSKLDFETDESHDIEVTASDGINVNSETFTINVIDMNGNTINGTSKADNINAISGPAGVTISDPSTSSFVATNEDDTIAGGNGNDTIDALDGNDTIDGGAGDDVLTGGDGNDTLTGGAGVDDIAGNDGDDVIRISGTNDTFDTLNGGDGTDTIDVLGTAAVVLAGFNGDDSSIEKWQGNGKQLVGTSAANIFDFTGVDVTDLSFIDGAGGDDTLIGGDGDDVLVGGAGADVLNGGAGSNTASYAASNAAVTIELGSFADGGHATGDLLTNIQNVTGSAKNDQLVGDDENNVLTGGAGFDELIGGKGDDTLVVSGTGDVSDILNGGDDDDTVLVTGATAVTLSGFNGVLRSIENFIGNDLVVNGTGGNDLFKFNNVTVTQVLSVDGGSGNDQLFASADGMTLIGGAGNDTLTGGIGEDKLVGGVGVDTVNGGDGDDVIELSGANDTTDTINGGDDTDTVKVTGTAALTLAGFNGVTSSIEAWDGNGKQLLGTSAANIFDFTGVAVSGLSFIDVGSGNDTVIGGNGFDYDLRGGVGNDTLTGGDGNDTLTGGAGVDALNGGDGNDTFVLAGTGDATDTFVGGGDTDTIKASGLITLAGFDAGAADIEQWTGTGSSNLTGTAANETFDLSSLTAVSNLGFVHGGSGDDMVIGSDAWDGDLRGGAGNDTLTGGAGNDTLTGGTGNDVLDGGDGDDTFVISGTTDQLDTFTGGIGTDTIKTSGAVTLSGFDAAVAGIEQWMGTVNAELMGTAANDTFDLSGLTAVSKLSYVHGGSGNDTITGSDDWNGDLRGGGGNDTLIGAGGNDKLSGGAGVDTFVIEAGGGKDTILDLTFKSKAAVDATDDLIDLTSYGFADFDAVLDEMVQVGGNVVITFDANNTLTINNTTLAILNAHADDFLL